MKLAGKITETIVGKNEAGLSEFVDTGTAIEMGDKAFTIKGEDPFSGETKLLYFKDLVKANMYKDGVYIVEALS
jgi:hypothetical protein